MHEQILDQIPVMVIAVDLNMEIIYLNSASRDIFNKSTDSYKEQPFHKLFNIAPDHAASSVIKLAIDTQENQTGRSQLTIGNSKMPIEIYAVPLKDSEGTIIGGLEYLLDITQRVSFEKKLQEQSHTIKEISTPALTLWDGVLVLPVIGIIDSLRAQHMMDTMLEKIMETAAKVIILDIQGVPAVDTAVANHLIKITKATSLMGCQCILSGISPAVAQAIVQLGIDMGNIKTNSSLKNSLSDAFSILNLKITANENE
nr:STAS domain-containing protein [Pectinatus sottacetonis]